MRTLNEMIERVKSLDKGELKNVWIEWKPYEEEAYQVRYADVTMGLENPNVKKDEILVSLYSTLFTIPCSKFSEEGITAEDQKGSLNLYIDEGKDERGYDLRYWRTSRDTVGSVALTYRVFPRTVPKDYRFHPYIDFRNEPRGASFTGMTTLVAPKADSYHEKYHIHFNWDFSAMPSDTWGASVRGEGDYDYCGTAFDYQYVMYAFGKLKVQRFYDGQFKLYWLSEELPDKKRVLDGLPKIYKALAEFFQDGEAPYSVFIRKDPFKLSNGATAFYGGFVYGYSEEKPLNLDMAIDIFTHEVIHTWPRIEDIAGEGTWYHEGTAELYSILIPYRCGVTDLDFVAKQISWRGLEYYSNPFKELANTEAYPLYWKERKAQWLPYGRGFFYLVDIDCRLRKQSGGKTCLDNLVIELEQRRRGGSRVTCSDWEELIERELGNGAVTEFREIMNGKLIEPSEEWFDGAFSLSKGSVIEPVRETVDEGAYIWTRKPDRVKAEL